jgi:hypothetical protein
VSELVGSVCLGLADLITDAITYARLRSGEVAVPNEGYKAAYAAVLSVGAVTTVLSMLYRLRNAQIMRTHLRELGEQGRTESTSMTRQQAQQHEWELAQTHRTKVISMLALLSVATQGSPPLQAVHNARVSHDAVMKQEIAGKIPVRWVLQVYRCRSSTAVLSSSATNQPTRWCAHSWAATGRNAPRDSPLRLWGYNRQVLGSLLVSVLLIGIKLTGANEIVQSIARRKELKANLLLLQMSLEDEGKKSWIEDVTHDTAQRQDRILELGSASGLSYTTTENEILQKGAAMFAVFESSSLGVKPLTHSATVMYSETKLDAATGLLLGRAAAMVRATPQEIVAYYLNIDSRHTQSTNDPAVFVRDELLHNVNAHHAIKFLRCKATGISDRTFLNSIVAKKVQDDLPTYMVVAMPIAQHDKITAKDEKGAVRAEACRAFQLTEVAAGITKLEYTCSLNLRGSIPQTITNKVSVPAQMHGAPPERLPHASFAVRPVCFARKR